jgi:hypothetical protein
MLLKRHRERQKYNEYLVGLIASQIVNYSMSPPEKGKTPFDFPLPLLRLPEPGKRKRVDKKKVIAQEMEAMNAYAKRFLNPKKITRQEADKMTRAELYGR